jgi:hypothetical protein
VRQNAFQIELCPCPTKNTLGILWGKLQFSGKLIMRQAQIGVFILGLVSFLAAAFFLGQLMGDSLWRIGVAAMITDIVFMKLWPLPKP